MLTKKIFFPLGVTLLLLSIVFTVILLVVSSKVLDDYERYDTDKIQKNGRIVNAKVIGVNIRNNITSDGVNPRVITYEYFIEGKNVVDYFQTIELQKIAKLKQDDSLEVYVYNDQSVIKDLAPFKIPLRLFWLMPIIFASMGVLFLYLSWIKPFKP